MILQGHASDPTITHVVESAGMAVPLTIILTAGQGARQEPRTRKTKFTTPAEILADNQLSGGAYHGTDSAVKHLAASAGLMTLDGFIINYLYHCRPVSLFSCVTKRYLEENVGLPALELEFDLADNRAYGADSMRTKLETFAHMLRARKRG